MNRSHRVSTLALVLLASGACVDRQPAAPEPDEAAASASAGQQAQGWNRDDEFARVARAEVPGFAGYYLDAEGTPVILLKDHKQRGAADRYLAAEIEDARRGRAGGSRAASYRKVTHDFADLKGWFDKLGALPSMGEVTMMDVDEVQNRVLVGVRSEAAIQTIRREAARLRVPPGVLQVEVRRAPEQLIGLQDRTAYLAGGYKVEAFTGGGCTLGFNATHLGISVFVTNSHCTYTFLAYDGGTFTQPTYFQGNEIGTELVDKALYNCNNSTLVCRRSDAAYVQHNGTRTVGQGKIAYTEQATGAAAPNLTVLGYYDIIRRYSGTAPVGLALTKTGQMTGTTFGNITQSCVSLSGYGRGNKYYSYPCQDVSNVYAEGGDSGSPMYRRVSTTQVELYGILWGRSDAGGTSSSRLSGIEADLGPLLNLCAPGYGC